MKNVNLQEVRGVFIGKRILRYTKKSGETHMFFRLFPELDGGAPFVIRDHV